MSRTRKKYVTSSYRHIRGNKKARIHNLRSIPPSSLDDIRGDDQSYQIWNIVDKMFWSGMQIEEITNKMRNTYKIARWQIKEVIGHKFDSNIKIDFMNDFVAISEDESELIPISTPNAEPHLAVKIDGLPLENNVLIIAKHKLLRWHMKKYEHTSHWGGHYVDVNKIHQFPNKKLTNILLFIGEHYVENGMIHNYAVRKWKMGFDKCEVEYFTN